jgi:hypothetical protein
MKHRDLLALVRHFAEQERRMAESYNVDLSARDGSRKLLWLVARDHVPGFLPAPARPTTWNLVRRTALTIAMERVMMETRCRPTAAARGLASDRRWARLVSQKRSYRAKTSKPGRVRDTDLERNANAHLQQYKLSKRHSGARAWAKRLLDPAKSSPWMADALIAAATGGLDPQVKSLASRAKPGSEAASRVRAVISEMDFGDLLKFEPRKQPSDLPTRAALRRKTTG